MYLNRQEEDIRTTFIDSLSEKDLEHFVLTCSDDELHFTKMALQQKADRLKIQMQADKIKQNQMLSDLLTLAEECDREALAKHDKETELRGIGTRMQIAAIDQQAEINRKLGYGVKL